MKAHKIVVCLLVMLVSHQAFALDDEYKAYVVKFIKAVKDKDIDALASITMFPIARENPIPPISNKADLQNRFEQLFDDKLYNEIVSSDPDKNWSAMGYRGIMLNNGSIWLEVNGKLKAINYQSPAEEKLKEKLIAQSKTRLHPSIVKFSKPEAIIKTKKFLIRIDQMRNDNYRYAAWPIKKSMADKPDIILKNGRVVFEGSGGNHYYEFKNGIYTYRCFITVIGEDDSLGALTVYKNGKQVLQQEITSLKD